MTKIINITPNQGTLFSELIFKQHATTKDSISTIFSDAKAAEMFFENGYSASVISGKAFYTDEYNPYEIAVMYDDAVIYDTPITDDVIGYLNEREAEKILQAIKLLPVRTKLLTAKRTL